MKSFCAIVLFGCWIAGALSNAAELPSMIAREHGSYAADKQPYIEKAYEAGVKTFWLSWSVPFLDEKNDVFDRNMKTLATRIDGILQDRPGAKVILQLMTTIRVRNYAGFLKNNPDALEVWPPDMRKGDRGCPVSDKILPVQIQSIEWLAEYLLKTGYDKKIAGTVICGGDDEWMDYWDYSEDARKDFARWIKQRYHSDLSALRKAWNGKAIGNFEEITIPQWETITAAGNFGIFRDPEKEGYVIDYLLYHRTRLQDVFLALARAFKKGCKNSIEVGMWGGGYAPGSPSSDLYYSYGKERNPSAFMAALPEVDFFISPYSYRERHTSGVFYHVVSGYHLYGKKQFAEEDTRTFKTPFYAKYKSWETLGDNFGKAGTPAETIEVLKRNFAGIFTHPDTGVSYFSLGSGLWFDDDRILATFKVFSDILKQRKSGGESAAQVALIFGNDNFQYQAMSNFRALYCRQTLDLARTGAPLDVYYLSDLRAKNFPFEKYKVFIFSDVAHIDREQRDIIENKIKNGNRTLIWFYAPGIVSNDRLSLDACSKLVGIKLESLGGELNLKFGMCLLPDRFDHKFLTGFPKGMRLSADLSVFPVIWVDDKDAVVLAEALASDRQLASFRKPGLAVKEFDDYKSVYVATPILPPLILRNIFRDAGVHIYSEDGGQVFAGCGIFAVNALSSGRHVVEFPQNVRVYDPFSGREIAAATRRLELNLKKGETALYLVEEEK